MSAGAAHLVAALVAAAISGGTAATPCGKPDALRQLARVTLGRAPQELMDRHSKAFCAEGGSVDSFIEALLNDEHWPAEVAPRLISGDLKSVSRPLNPDYTLKTTSSGRGAPAVYYLRRACPANEAQPVRPWWDFQHEVRICPEAYQPTHLEDDRGNQCGSPMLDPTMSEYCGCGPNLIFCQRNSAHRDELQRSLLAEITRTTSLVVAGDRPIETLYLQNETYRDRNAEFFYRRWAIVNGAPPQILADLGDWPKEGRLARRTELVDGLHAGVLTTQYNGFRFDSQRNRLDTVFEELWCTHTDSVKVDADRILGLGAVNLRAGDGWKKLASSEPCSFCHARLDYGVQFFSGFPYANVAINFRVRDAHPTEVGHLYGFSVDEKLGEGPMTPRGFAGLAVADERFLRCRATRLLDAVLVDRYGGEEVQVVLQALSKRHSIRDGMRAALGLLAGRTLTPTGTPTSTSVPGGGRSPGNFAGLFGKECRGCHESDEFLDRGSVKPSQIMSLLHQVGFGRMPKGGRLTEDKRALVIRELTAGRWKGEGARKKAGFYFGDLMRSAATYDIDTLMNELRSIGDIAEHWDYLESRISPAEQQYTPGLAVMLGLQALKACRARGLDGGALKNCVAQGTDPARAIRDVPGRR